MSRFLKYGTLAACVLAVLGAAGAAAAGLPRHGRRRPPLRHRHRSRRPARHDAHPRRLPGARRREAAADHAVRRQPATHPAHRHARRLRQHGGQPSAAARRGGGSFSRGCARTTSRASARSDATITISPSFTRNPGELQAALPDTIATDAPTPLWRALDEAIGRLRRRGRRAPRGARAERRQGQRPDRLPPAHASARPRSSTARARRT